MTDGQARRGADSGTLRSWVMFVLIAVVLIACILLIVNAAGILGAHPVSTLVNPVSAVSLLIALVCFMLWVADQMGVTPLPTGTAGRIWATLIVGVLGAAVTLFTHPGTAESGSRVPPGEIWQVQESSHKGTWNVTYDGSQFACDLDGGTGMLCRATASGEGRAVERIVTPDNNRCIFFGTIAGAAVTGNYTCERVPGWLAWNASVTATPRTSTKSRSDSSDFDKLRRWFARLPGWL